MRLISGTRSQDEFNYFQNEASRNVKDRMIGRRQSI